MALFDPADARPLTERERSTLDAAITLRTSGGPEGRPGPELPPVDAWTWLR